jgi:hypothetical protein
MSSRSLSALISAGVLSCKAHATIAQSLNILHASGLPKSVGEFFVHFNGITASDELCAQKAGVAFHGSYEDIGIYRGYREIAQRARNPYVLLLQNTIVPVEGVDVEKCLSSCIADMIKHDIQIFSVCSRANPGADGRWRPYLRCFPVKKPVNPQVSPQGAPVFRKAQMCLSYGSLGKFRGSALYVEQSPEIAQPKAVRKLPSGNFITDSRFHDWSNQAVLIDRKFFLEVICKRIEESSEPRLIDEDQAIERTISSWWWRRRREPLGHAAEGAFTYAPIES